MADSQPIGTPVSGGYGCVDIPTFFGKLIRLFTHSPYSHAFVVLDAASGQILEARPEGAQLRHLSEYQGLRQIYSTDYVLNGDVEALRRAAEPFVGIPYGFLDIVYLGLANLGIRWKWLLRQVRRQDRMICSQLVAEFGYRAGQPGWCCGQSEPQLVEPSELAARAATEQRTSAERHA